MWYQTSCIAEDFSVSGHGIDCAVIGTENKDKRLLVTLITVRIMLLAQDLANTFLFPKGRLQTIVLLSNNKLQCVCPWIKVKEGVCNCVVLPLPFLCYYH